MTTPLSRPCYTGYRFPAAAISHAVWLYQIANLFRRPANTNAADHRRNRGRAFLTWAGITGLAAAA